MRWIDHVVGNFQLGWKFLDRDGCRVALGQGCCDFFCERVVCSVIRRCDEEVDFPYAHGQIEEVFANVS